MLEKQCSLNDLIAGDCSKPCEYCIFHEGSANDFVGNDDSVLCTRCKDLCLY